MGELSDKDVDRIADRMVEHIQETHHDFWIDPQIHYDDHKSMREVVKSYADAKSIFGRAFIGLVALGSVILMGIAAMKSIGASAMGMGLFFIKPDLAAQVASPIAMIATALVGLVSVYMGTATWDDK